MTPLPPLPPVPVPEGMITALAIGAAAEVLVRQARRLGLPGDAAFRAFLAAVACGLLGGHVLFVAVHGPAAGLGWLRFWGGQSVFGVLAGGAVGGIIYLRLRRLPLLRFADAAAPGVAAGYAVARLGCLLHGDDFGAVTGGVFGIRYPAGSLAWIAHVERGWLPPDAAASLPVIPVQAVLALVGAIVAGVLLRRPPNVRPGGAAGLACAVYGLARLGLEPLRDDFHPVLGPLSLSQLLAIALLAAGAALLAPRTAAAPARRPLAGAVLGERPR